jgi:hypothetical protein
MQSLMRWSRSRVRSISKSSFDTDMDIVQPYVVAAIKRIIGKVPAQMRPRSSSISLDALFRQSILRVCTAYGSHNDVVLDVASVIGQDIVLWNLE